MRRVNETLVGGSGAGRRDGWSCGGERQGGEHLIIQKQFVFEFRELLSPPPLLHLRLLRGRSASRTVGAVREGSPDSVLAT